MEKQVTDYFGQCIGKWLEDEKRKDAAFAKKVEESKKEVEGCCNYIISQVQASKQCGFADEEIYGMARHYFDEDDVKNPGKQASCRVVVSGHIDLSESEKAEAMRRATEQYKADLRKADEERKAKAEQAEKERKAKLREKKMQETAVQGDLFGF